MESAHLTKAHEHVRTAATATFSNSIATAGHEHDLAATAFGDAAQDTHNAEALRILGLLHDHHRKLAGLIKEAPRNKDHKSTASTRPAHAPSSSSSTSLPSNNTAARSASSPSSPPAPRRRLPQSSIATNLAEKRGIPSVKRTTSGPPPLASSAAPSLRNEQPSPARALLERQSKQNPPPRQQKDAAPSPASPAEDNFRRFYSAFGGVISAISAPLAFTSLPLNVAPPTPVPEPPKDERARKTASRNHSPEASRTVKSSVPDLAALISKPALRALRDGSSQINPFASNESFYLVPTSGGTVTYASILQNSQASALPSIDEATDSLKGSSHEEFVDARESINPPSPIISRRPQSRGNTAPTATGVTSQRSIPAGRGSGLKTLEELSLENETLKALVDKQAQRIQMWETNSQNQFNALAQSFRTKTLAPLSTYPSHNVNNINNNNNSNSNTNHTGTSLPSPPIAHHYPNQTLTPASPPPPPLLSSDPLPAGAATPTPTAGAAEAAANPNHQQAALESLLAAQTAKLSAALAANEHLARQNDKNAQVIARYREQWEKLKAGARKKEQERRERMDKGLKKDGVDSGAEAEAEAKGGLVVDDDDDDAAAAAALATA